MSEYTPVATSFAPPTGTAQPVVTHPNQPKKNRTMMRILVLGVIAIGLGILWQVLKTPPATQEIEPSAATQKSLAQVLFTTALTDELTTVQAYAEVLTVPVPGQEFVLNLGDSTVTAGVTFSTQLFVLPPTEIEQQTAEETTGQATDESALLSDVPQEESLEISPKTPAKAPLGAPTVQPEVPAGTSPGTPAETPPGAPSTETTQLSNVAYLYALQPGDMITVLLATTPTGTTIKSVHFTSEFIATRTAGLKAPPYVKINPFFIPNMQFTARERKELETGTVISEEATVLARRSDTELQATVGNTERILILTPATVVQVVTTVEQQKDGTINSFEMSTTDPKLVRLLETGNRIRIEYPENQADQDSLSLTKLLLYTF